MDIIGVTLAIGVFIIAMLLTIGSLSSGFLFLLLLTPLVHKELFSLVVWDLLPVRVALMGIGVVSLVRLAQWIRKVSIRQAFEVIKGFILKDPVFLFLLSLLLVRIISLYKSDALSESLKLLAFYLSVVYIYVFMKILWMKSSFPVLKKAINIYVILGAATAIFALVQYYFRSCCRLSIGGIWVVPGHSPRLGSTFWDVNHYGGFLAMLLPILFSFIFLTKSKVLKVIYAIELLFLAVILYQTNSRSAWIGVSVSFVVSLILYYAQNLKKPLILALVSIVLIVASCLSYTTYKNISIKESIANYMHYRLDSTDTHMMLLQGATEVLHNNIYIGGGYGNFDSAFRQTDTAQDYFEREPKLEDVKVPAHSVWGEIMAETGFPGIVIFSLMVIYIFSMLIVAIFEEPDVSEKYYMTGLFGAVLALLATGIFYSYNLEFFWIMIFITSGYANLKLGEKYNVVYILKWWRDKKITPYLLIVPPILFFIYINLGDNTLIDWDEAIYAKVAKNIVQSGDWMTLRWYDMNKYWFEKPPLYMWLTAWVFELTGFKSFGARFVSALCGAAGVWVVYLFGKRIYNRLTGIMAALILLSTVHYLYYARNGMLDVTVTLFILCSVYFFYLSSIENMKGNIKKSIIYAALIGVSLGLGVMTKSVVGLLPLPVLGMVYLYDKYQKQKTIPYQGILLAITAFTIVAVPWHLYQYSLYGDAFVKQYFIEHIIDRGLSGLGHNAPLLWYLEVIKTSLRLWTFALIPALICLPFIDKEKKREYLLLTLTASFIFIFFSWSKDKLQWYIIPIYPFLALMSARLIERASWYANKVVRGDLRVSNTTIRFVAFLAVYLVAMFSIVQNKDKIYYPDFNKDKLALIDIFNDSYPMAEFPDKVLYYNSVSPPVLYFYTDHKVESVTKDDIIRKIEDAGVDESNVFMTKESLFYNISNDQNEVKAPLVMDIKGSTNDWVLFKSKSRSEIATNQFNAVRVQIAALNISLLAKTITPVEKVKLKELQIQYLDLLALLNSYGHPQLEDPFLIIKFK